VFYILLALADADKHGYEIARYYRLTEPGRRVLDAELQRYARVVAVARGRDLLASA
jgi:hypothetical protein